MTVLLPSYVSIDTQFDIEFIQVRFISFFPLVFYSSITAVPPISLEREIVRLNFSTR